MSAYRFTGYWLNKARIFSDLFQLQNISNKIKFHFGLARKKMLRNFWKITITIERTKTILLVPFSLIVESSYWLIPKHYFLKADIRSSFKSQFDKRLRRENNTAKRFWWQFLTTNTNRHQNLKIINFILPAQK